MVFMRAVLLIRVNPTKEKIVADTLRTFPDVIKDVFVVFGEFDVVAIVESTNPESLGRFVTQKVRQIEGVIKTATLLAIG